MKWRRGVKMKKSLKRMIVLTCVLVFGLVSLVGCNQEKANENTDPFAKLQDRGYVVMGLDDTFAPMGFKDASGKIVGFDVDLAKEVFERIGLEVRFQPIDWTMKEAELTSGNIDLIWNGYTITEERKEKVAFTEPYLENKQIVVVLADSTINAKADLAGKKVAIQNQSSAVDAVNTEPELVASFDGGEPILFETNNECFMDLEAKRADAVVADEVLARYYIKQRGAEKYKVLEEYFAEEEYGIGVRKEDTKLLAEINKAMNEMREDGTYDEIYLKWFAN
jgi:polar amino acid transport system substrate-binding protein